jgi:hypothetical protein
MLEEDLRTMFEKQAAASQPPAPFGVALIRRRASAARRRHLVAGLASPVVAAGAVAAIAFAALPPGVPAHRSGPSPTAASTAPGTTPKLFNPFRPYAAFGWLPSHQSTHVGSFLTRTEVLEATRPTGPNSNIELDVVAAGQCHVTKGRLTCKYQQDTVGAGDRLVGRAIGRVDGHEAYWTPGQDRRGWPFPVPSVLNWEYAPNAWATVAGPNLTSATTLRIARRAVFGPAAARPLRFTTQLQQVPADWHVFCTTAGWQGDVEYASSFDVTAQKPDANPGCGYAHQAPTIEEGVGSKRACASLMDKTARSRVIDGFHVLTEKYLSWTTLCASDADGDFVWIELGDSPRPPISTVNLFAHHLTLFGPNPANWVSAPIG